MHLYDITEYRTYTCSTKLSSKRAPNQSKFMRNIARVNISPDTSLKLKIAGANFKKYKSAYEKNEALTAICSQRPQDEMSCRLQDKKKSILEYVELCENNFINHTEIPENKTIDKMIDLEPLLFPLIVRSNNKVIPNVIHYFTDAKDVAKNIVEGPRGQQQFIYYDQGHAICVDAFKDKEDNISVITIDSMKAEDKLSHDCILAYEIFGYWDIKDGKLSMLNLQTDIQKSSLGCKYFSLAFAEQTAIDPNIISQHQLNIIGAKSKNSNIRHLLDLESSAKILGSSYYQHAHSSKRINRLTKERRDEIVSSAGSLSETHENYRVTKTKDKDKTITFSNSIDFFRKKTLKNMMEQLNEEIHKNK